MENSKQIHKFVVSDTESGRRLDQFLADRVSWVSRIKLGKFIAEGESLLNDQPARAGLKVTFGDVVSIQLSDSMISAMTPEPIDLEIVYEDLDIIVLNKAAGMLVHPTQSVKTGTLANALSFHLNRYEIGHTQGTELMVDPAIAIKRRPGIVHRLDRGTSGLMVVAKNQRALSILSRHFHKKLVEKKYLAVIDGLPEAESLEISAPIGRIDAGPPFWRVLEAGRPALTRLRVLCKGFKRSVVELEPVTGRTNQLRIHCSYIGRPIVGDESYGGSSNPRLCLHAAQLGFHHPTGGDWIEFNSPMPIELLETFRSRSHQAIHAHISN